MRSWTISLGLLALTGYAYGADPGEMPLKVTELPPSVRTMLLHQAQGGTIKELVLETEHGRRIYSADVNIRGELYEINLTTDGKLISKQRDRDEEGAKGAQDRDAD